MITLNEALDTILADDGVQDVPEYIIRRMWPINGFDDQEALADLIHDISAFTFVDGRSVDDVMKVIDMVYDIDSSELKWLVKDISSMKAADATREDAKTTAKRIIEGLVELRKKAEDIRRKYE